MYHDGEACKTADTMWIVWSRRLDANIEEYADKLAAEYGAKATTSYRTQGAFNRCYEAKIEDKLYVILRFPILGKVAFRKEKVIDEILVMKYVSKHTSIPTPRLIRVSDSSWGPCIVMEHVAGKLLSDRLKASTKPEELEVLDPNIDLPTLTKAYRVMSKILIELSRCKFDKIGGISRNSKGRWCVEKRPMTVDTNQIVALANYPPDELPKDTFSTATDYFMELARNRMTHLRTQRNDAVEDEEDCRRKYIARCLFLKVAKTFSKTHNHGPFRLVCDDLRPSNVIVDDELNLRSVIDWEFSYAAPAEFVYCSPWWLLLAHPDDWRESLDDFLTQYLPRHETFLEVLKKYEDEEIERHALSESERLSGEMALSMQNGNFWFCFAATSSFAFDDIYWRFIDPVHFGEFVSIEDRIKLLDQEEQVILDSFVRLKMEQAKDRKLDQHRTLDEILAS